MPRPMRILAAGAAVTALIVPLAMASSAAANPSGTTGQITNVVTSGKTVQFVFTATGLPVGNVLDPSSVVVQSGGVSLPATASTGDAGDTPAAAIAPLRESMIVLDTSGSMQGDGIAGALSAALAYANALPADVRVGLETFADAPHILVKPTTDRATLRAALASVRANGNTALYDGLIAAVGAFGTTPQGTLKRLLLLSDGADTTSTHTLPQALQALTSGGVVADVVAFRLPGDQAVLDQFAAASKGQVIAAKSAADIAAAFTTAASEFKSQVLVTVQVPPALAGSQADLAVSVNAADRSVSANVLVTMPGQSSVNQGIGPQITNSTVGSASKVALWFVLGLAFVAILVVALLTLWIPSESTTRAKQRARLAEVGRYRVIAAVGRTEEQSKPVQAEGSVSKAALSFVDRLVRSRGAREGIVDQLDRAGLRMRPEEWAIIQVAAVVVLAAVLAVVSGNLLGLLLGAVLGYGGCVLFIRQKISRRSRAFNEQLPDVLQLIAGSLRSGFSLNQAVSAVVREGQEPTSSEIARALTEVRLGSELEDALDRVSVRMECPDLHWVVLAIRISREVGGNLAEVILNTVSTMRERAQIRGQIRVLSAEGRISARILIALPFLLLGYLLLFNSSYLQPLYTTGVGIALIIGGAVLLGIGSFWISRIVKIEV